MPIIAVNVIKVLFMVALYLFLFYVARSMRRHVVGSPVEERTPQEADTASRPRPAGAGPSAGPPVHSIVIIDAQGRQTTHPIHDTLILGRGDSADIRLDDEYASDMHASFTVVGNTVAVQDLGSTNGTTIGGQKIVGRMEVASGTTVLVGRTKVMIK